MSSSIPSTSFSNPFNDLTNFVSSVGDSISTTFRTISNFIYDVQMLGLNVWFLLLVFLFFAIIAGVVVLIVKGYPYFVELKKLYKRFFGIFDNEE